MSLNHWHYVHFENIIIPQNHLRKDYQVEQTVIRAQIVLEHIQIDCL